MMTNGDIFKAFNDLSRMDKEDFARYVVNNLANRSRERLLFYLAAIKMAEFCIENELI